MIRTHALALLAAMAAALPVRAQSLGQRILEGARDGGYSTVQFTFASRAGVCGDGDRFLSDGFGGDNRIYEDGNSGRWSRYDRDEACIPGPVRVAIGVDGRKITRLRTYVGTGRGGRDGGHRDLGVVPVMDAIDFLTQLVQQGDGRPAADAILPIVLADSVDPWPVLLRFARDERLPRNVRSTTDFWLSRGAAHALGVTGRDESDDDDVRAQAVFALSQQPRESAVPRLIDVVQQSSRPAVRAQALFWLGQSGDSRAIDLFEHILRRR